MWKSGAKGMLFFGLQRESKPPKPLPTVNQSISVLILMIGEYTNISREPPNNKQQTTNARSATPNLPNV
jgi:hypothetical protein